VVPNDIDGLSWGKSRTERPKYVEGITGTVSEMVALAVWVGLVALVAVTITVWALDMEGVAV
jgi:hypothetical protein